MLEKFKNNNKIVLIPLALVSFVSLAYLLFLMAPGNPNNLQGTELKPKIPKTYEEEFEIQLTMTEDEFNFPRQLPRLKNAPLKPMTIDEAKKVAATFGYNTEPKTANDIEEGVTYIWTGGGGNLFVYSKTRRIYFSSLSSIETINKQLTDDAIIKIGVDFAASHYAINTDNIRFSGFVFYSVLPERGDLNPANRQSANIYQVNYSVAKSDYPLLTLNPANTFLYVRILKDGNINSAVYTDLGGLEKSQEDYMLKNFKQVQDSLHEANIVTLDNGNINPDQIKKGDIQSVEITSVTLAYLMDSPNSPSFAPIYLLNGTATLKTSTSPMNVQLYLPAIADN
jgi:hypothetical protein